MEDDLAFDFESALDAQQPLAPASAAAAAAAGEPKPRNYRRTVCTYWVRGLCMKGENCGFLHQFDPQRMPVCRTLLKFGACKEPDCPYKHTTEDIKECNMYMLGFCIYGPAVRSRALSSGWCCSSVCMPDSTFLFLSHFAFPCSCFKHPLGCFRKNKQRKRCLETLSYLAFPSSPDFLFT
jgi:hypothetical protein